jgi:hypothetical protein
MFSLPALLEAGSDAQPARVLLGQPTKSMRDEAVDAGRYESRASGTTRIIPEGVR